MFLFFGGLPKKTNALGGHKGCVFSFLVLPEKTIGGHRGCVFPFLMLQKNKSNRRAQGSCFCFFLGWASKKNKPNRRAQGLCFLLLWCFHTKKKSNRRAQGLWFCFFWGCKKTNPIGGHKGCVFAFFWGFQKNKANRRAQGLCFLFLWCFQKKQLEGHKGCVFAFLVLSEKTNPIGGHKGCIFGFCGASKKKQIQYEGRDWRERLLERNKQSTCRRFASGSSLRFVRFGSLFYTLAVRFGFPTAGFWAVSGSRGSVPGSRFGSRTFLWLT